MEPRTLRCPGYQTGNVLVSACALCAVLKYVVYQRAATQTHFREICNQKENRKEAKRGMQKKYPKKSERDERLKNVLARETCLTSALRPSSVWQRIWVRSVYSDIGQCWIYSTFSTQINSVHLGEFVST